MFNPLPNWNTTALFVHCTLLAPATGEEPSPAVQSYVLNPPFPSGTRTDASTAVMPTGSVAVSTIALPSVTWSPMFVACAT